MRILITGAGFLGSNLARAAIARGDQVCVFDNLSRLGSSANLAWLREAGEFQHIHGDVRDRNDVDQAVGGFVPEAIFHLSGQVAMTTSIADPRKDFETNVLGTFNVLEAMRRWAADATMVYSSTNKVYGDLEWARYEKTNTRWRTVDFPQGFSETAPLDFHSPYGVSKGSADQYCLDYNRIYGLKTIVFRHSSMYGGRQFSTADQGWIGWFCQKAAEQAASYDTPPFTISGDGLQVRDVLYVNDMIALYEQVLRHGDEAAGQAFNIGGGMKQSLSLIELFQLLEEITGKPLRYESLPARASDQRVFVADIAKAERILRWTPKVSAAEGVAAMYRWVESGMRAAL